MPIEYNFNLHRFDKSNKHVPRDIKTESIKVSFENHGAVTVDNLLKQLKVSKGYYLQVHNPRDNSFVVIKKEKDLDIIHNDAWVRIVDKTTLNILTPNPTEVEVQKSSKERMNRKSFKAIHPVSRVSELIEQLAVNEGKFVSDLETTVKLYKFPLEKVKILPIQELDSLFSKIPDFLRIHTELLTSLNERKKEQLVSKLFYDAFANNLQLWEDYFNGHGLQLELVAHYSKSSQSFRKIETASTSGLQLSLAITKPMKHILSYPGLVQEILDEIDSSDREEEYWKKLYNLIADKEPEWNLHIEIGKELAEIPKKLTGYPGRIAQPDRELIKEGKVSKQHPRKEYIMQERYLYLFNDALVYCKPKGIFYEYKGMIPLKIALVTPIHNFIAPSKSKSSKETKLAQQGFHVINLTTKRKFVFLCANQEEADDWVTAIDASLTPHLKNMPIKRRMEEDKEDKDEEKKDFKKDEKQEQSKPKQEQPKPKPKQEQSKPKQEQSKPKQEQSKPKQEQSKPKQEQSKPKQEPKEEKPKEPKELKEEKPKKPTEEEPKKPKEVKELKEEEPTEEKPKEEETNQIKQQKQETKEEEPKDDQKETKSQVKQEEQGEILEEEPKNTSFTEPQPSKPRKKLMKRQPTGKNVVSNLTKEEKEEIARKRLEQYNQLQQEALEKQQREPSVEFDLSKNQRFDYSFLPEDSSDEDSD